MQKRMAFVVSLLLSLMLLLCSIPAYAAEVGFADVSETAWYAAAVDYVHEQGIMAGDGKGNFMPQQTMTRAMLATTMAAYTENYRKEDFMGRPSYVDVDDRLWFGPPVLWSKRAKLLVGDENSLFHPYAAATREQAVTLLYRYAEKTGNKVSYTEGASATFADSKEISSWAEKAMDWAVTHGILRGTGKGLQPHKALSRAEMAMLLYQARDILQSRYVIYHMTETAEKLGITADNYPRIDTSRHLGLLEWRLDYLMHGDTITADTTTAGTMQAYQKLIAGENDLILVPKGDETVVELAAQAGVELDYYQIARDGLVFITAQKNLTEGITMDQVRKLYLETGTGSWAEFGGPDLTIVPIVEAGANMDAHLRMEDLVLQGKKPLGTLPLTNELHNMISYAAFYQDWVKEEASSESYALGYTRYTSLLGPNIPSENLRMLHFDGVAPTVESIVDGSYPLTFSYYAVVRGDLPEDDPARKLASWLQGPEGQVVLEKDGWIGLSKPVELY